MFGHFYGNCLVQGMIASNCYWSLEFYLMIRIQLSTLISTNPCVHSGFLYCNSDTKHNQGS